MRGVATIVAVALGTILAQGARAQDCTDCKWHPIVSSITLGTIDLYPGLDSKDACERLVAEAPAPDLAAADVTVECVESSRLKDWLDHFPVAPR